MTTTPSSTQQRLSPVNGEFYPTSFPKIHCKHAKSILEQKIGPKKLAQNIIAEQLHEKCPTKYEAELLKSAQIRFVNHDRRPFVPCHTLTNHRRLSQFQISLNGFQGDDTIVIFKFPYLLRGAQNLQQFKKIHMVDLTLDTTSKSINIIPHSKLWYECQIAMMVSERFLCKVVFFGPKLLEVVTVECYGRIVEQRDLPTMINFIQTYYLPQYKLELKNKFLDKEFLEFVEQFYANPEKISLTKAFFEDKFHKLGDLFIQFKEKEFWIAEKQFLKSLTEQRPTFHNIALTEENEKVTQEQSFVSEKSTKASNSISFFSAGHFSKSKKLKQVQQGKENSMFQSENSFMFSISSNQAENLQFQQKLKYEARECGQRNSYSSNSAYEIEQTLPENLFQKFSSAKFNDPKGAPRTMRTNENSSSKNSGSQNSSASKNKTVNYVREINRIEGFYPKNAEFENPIFDLLALKGILFHHALLSYANDNQALAPYKFYIDLLYMNRPYTHPFFLRNHTPTDEDVLPNLRIARKNFLQKKDRCSESALLQTLSSLLLSCPSHPLKKQLSNYNSIILESESGDFVDKEKEHWKSLTNEYIKVSGSYRNSESVYWWAKENKKPQYEEQKEGEEINLSYLRENVKKAETIELIPQKLIGEIYGICSVSKAAKHIEKDYMETCGNILDLLFKGYESKEKKKIDPLLTTSKIFYLEWDLIYKFVRIYHYGPDKEIDIASSKLMDFRYESEVKYHPKQKFFYELEQCNISLGNINFKIIVPDIEVKTISIPIHSKSAFSKSLDIPNYVRKQQKEEFSTTVASGHSEMVFLEDIYQNSSVLAKQVKEYISNIAELQEKKFKCQIELMLYTTKYSCGYCERVLGSGLVSLSTKLQQELQIWCPNLQLDNVPSIPVYAVYTAPYFSEDYENLDKEEQKKRNKESKSFLTIDKANPRSLFKPKFFNDVFLGKFAFSKWSFYYSSISGEPIKNYKQAELILKEEAEEYTELENELKKKGLEEKKREISESRMDEIERNFENITKQFIHLNLRDWLYKAEKFVNSSEEEE